MTFKRKPVITKKITRSDLITAVTRALNANFQYDGINSEYDTDCSDCDPGDYHRCCRITDFHIISIETKSIIDSIVDCFDIEHDRCRVTRLLTNDGALENADNYEPEIGGSYYGEELRSIKLCESTQSRLLEKICATIEAMQP